MLSLQLQDGEYLTIGEDIVVQVFTNSAIRVSVQAPRDMTILRGEVRERGGEACPQCLSDAKKTSMRRRSPAKSKKPSSVSPG